MCCDLFMDIRVAFGARARVCPCAHRTRRGERRPHAGRTAGGSRSTIVLRVRRVARGMSAHGGAWYYIYDYMQYGISYILPFRVRT